MVGVANDNDDSLVLQPTEVWEADKCKPRRTSERWQRLAESKQGRSHCRIVGSTFALLGGSVLGGKARAIASEGHACSCGKGGRETRGGGDGDGGGGGKQDDEGQPE